MAQAQSPERPLSPHLQVWRWHVTMATSILHRAAGIALYVGVMALVVWLCALVAGPDLWVGLMTAVPGFAIEALVYAMTAVLAFHLANGVRHLFFDVGSGFKPAAANATAWLAILFAIAAPIALFVLLHVVRAADL